MKFKPLLIYMAILALIPGCARIKVSSTFDHSYDFQKIASYQWTDASREILEQEDTYLDLALQKALNNELAARGWKQVLDSTNASVRVAYYVKITAHQEFAGAMPAQDREFSGGLVFDGGNGNWNYEERAPDQTEYTVEMGTLHLLISDAGTSQAVWQGTVETAIDRSQREEKRDELFRAVARKLIEELP